MVVDQVLSLPADAIAQLGRMALWLQALGIILVLYVIFQTITLILNWRRMKELYKIKEDIKRIESKIDKLVRKN